MYDFYYNYLGLEEFFDVVDTRPNSDVILSSVIKYLYT